MRGCVIALAKATFREAIRDRVLFVVVLFALGLLLFSRVLGWLSVEDEMKMVQDFSLSGIGLLGLFLSMLVGAFALAKEMERRTACSILARDISRGEFIIGKYIGLLAVFWICIAGAGGCLVGWVLLWGGDLSPALGAALLGLLAEAAVLTAVALFLGALTNAAVAAVGTAAFYLAGHSTEVLREMTLEGKNPEFAGTYQLLYRILPNLEDVNYINATTSASTVEWGALGLGTLGILCWTVVFLIGAGMLFSRREL